MYNKEKVFVQSWHCYFSIIGIVKGFYNIYTLVFNRPFQFTEAQSFIQNDGTNSPSLFL